MEIILVSDGEIKLLNKQWFRRDCSTDVITFGDKKDEFAEIYISVDAARRQAFDRDVSMWQELLRLCIHGIAHLGGYDDGSLDDFCAMREKEWGMILRALEQ